MPVLSRNNDATAVGPKDGFSLSDQVPAGATDREVRITVDTAATIERMEVRIYQGPELDLEIEPVRRPNAANVSDQPLLEYSGKEYVDGDDDLYTWQVAEPVEEGDEIVIIATNRDGSNAYDYRVNFDVDYHGGSSRGILSALQGGVL